MADAPRGPDGHQPDDPAPTPAAAGRDVAVSIEPSTAGDRVTVFARACGLTPREAELLQHLAGGATTREVARQMFVSENTVQDHLKSIFDKSTARSRRALLARALGPDRVFGVYIMQLCAESPDGWRGRIRQDHPVVNGASV